MANKQLPAVIDDDEIHAVYSPSAAKRWINCPGSINLCKDLPRQKPNFYSAEGSVAHLYASEKLLGSKAGAAIGSTALWEGFEIPVTKEMIEAVNVYLEFVFTLAKKYDETPEIERKVKVTQDCFGTTDSCLYVPYVIMITNDYKHGVGYVDADDNEQTMIYTLGRLLELPHDEVDELPKVQMNIIQPRAKGDAIKTFEMRTKDLLEWHQQVLLPAIAKTKEPDAPLKAGEWCKYCPAALDCPELKKQRLEVAKLAFEQPSKWVDVLTPKQIADLLDKEPMINAFYKRLKEHAADLASKKTKFPGYAYEKSYGHRVWKDSCTAADYLESKVGKRAWEEKLISPPQAEKLGVPKEEIKKLVEVPYIGYKLKKSNGKEITVKDVFEDV